MGACNDILGQSLDNFAPLPRIIIVMSSLLDLGCALEFCSGSEEWLRVLCHEPVREFSLSRMWLLEKLGGDRMP